MVNGISMYHNLFSAPPGSQETRRAGEDTEAIISGYLGYSARQIADLRSRGVI